MRRHAGLATLTVVLVALTSFAPTADAATATRYPTKLTGTWTTESCVPTSIDPIGFPIFFTGVCSGTSTGTWAGKFVSYSYGEMDEQLGVKAKQDLYFSGRAPDGTCGTVHVRQAVTISGDSWIGELHARSKIVKGTGAWKGSTGSYEAQGLYLSGVGHGNYAGTWYRPGRPATAPLESCRTSLPPLKV